MNTDQSTNNSKSMDKNYQSIGTSLPDRKHLSADKQSTTNIEKMKNKYGNLDELIKEGTTPE